MLRQKDISAEIRRTSSHMRRLFKVVQNCDFDADSIVQLCKYYSFVLVVTTGQ